MLKMIKNIALQIRFLKSLKKAGFDKWAMEEAINNPKLAKLLNLTATDRHLIKEPINIKLKGRQAILIEVREKIYLKEIIEYATDYRGYKFPNEDGLELLVGKTIPGINPEARIYGPDLPENFSLDGDRFYEVPYLKYGRMEIQPVGLAEYISVDKGDYFLLFKE